MNPNTPVGCPQCGGQMDLWQADTAAFYVPGTGELVKCPVCGKEHPRDDAFCPLCGTRRDQPCPWCGKWFPAAQPVCPWCGHGRDEE